MDHNDEYEQRTPEQDNPDEGYPWFITIVNTPKYLVYMGLIIFFVFATAFHFVEHYSLYNSGYWTFITSLGIGYGDVTPHHNLGKALASILGVTTEFFFIPMIVGSILSRMIVDRNAFTNAEQEELKHAIRKIEAALDVERDEEEEEEAGK